jgi:hypothetical protein
LLKIFTYLGSDGDKKIAATLRFSCKEREGSCKKWQLHSNYKSQSCVLSNDNMTVQNTSNAHSYVLGTEVLKKGIHAWRVTRLAQQTQWLALGITALRAHAGSVYQQNTFWGMSGSSQWYRAGVNSSQGSNFANGPIDVMYDTKKGELKIMNHGANRTTYTMQGVPKTGEFVPVFCPYYQQKMTVTILDHKKWGVL